MPTAKTVANFAAWLQDRSDEQAHRLTAMTLSDNKHLAKTEHAELLEIQEAFIRLVVDKLAPVQRALFLATIDIRRQRQNY